MTITMKLHQLHKKIKECDNLKKNNNSNQSNEYYNINIDNSKNKKNNYNSENFVRVDRNYFRFNPGKEGKFGLKKHNLSGNPVHSRLSSKKTLDSIRLTHKFKKSMNNKTEKRNKRKRIVLDAWSDYQSPILEKQQCEIKYHNKIKNNIRNYQDNTSTLPKKMMQKHYLVTKKI